VEVSVSNIVKNSIVQIDAKGSLDKALHGCIGFANPLGNNEFEVHIYYPKEKGKNAFVIKQFVEGKNLIYIGEASKKPL
jgi:hypothetical protein